METEIADLGSQKAPARRDEPANRNCFMMESTAPHLYSTRKRPTGRSQRPRNLGGRFGLLDRRHERPLPEIMAGSLGHLCRGPSYVELDIRALQSKDTLCIVRGHDGLLQSILV